MTNSLGGRDEQQTGRHQGSKAKPADTTSQWLPVRTSLPTQTQPSTAADVHQIVEPLT